jgi:hypothetical protein
MPPRECGRIVVDMKMKTKMWIGLIGALLLVLALGGWAVDAIRWPFASARLQWRLALSTR